MSVRKNHRFADDTMQLSIKQVVDAGLVDSSGIVHISEAGPGKPFPAWIEGHGDHIIITIHGGWGDTVQGVALTDTFLHFGGSRKWFICPECNERRGVLYVHERVACRSCFDLVYASQYEPPADRMRRQLLKIRRAIGTGMEIGGPFAPPPPGMSKRHWKALVAEYIELREKYYRETERPRRWRNEAPKAAHWRLKERVPASSLNGPKLKSSVYFVDPPRLEDGDVNTPPRLRRAF